MIFKSRISATVVGLALLAGTAVSPVFAQQEDTPPAPVPQEVTPDASLEETTPKPDSNDVANPAEDPSVQRGLALAEQVYNADDPVQA